MSFQGTDTSSLCLFEGNPSVTELPFRISKGQKYGKGSHDVASSWFDSDIKEIDGSNREASQVISVAMW